jgi:hypothetical protein
MNAICACGQTIYPRGADTCIACFHASLDTTWYNPPKKETDE